MEEPAELVCWRMELVKISFKELELLGEGEILVKHTKSSGFEHLKVSPEKKLWWDSNSEEWDIFEEIEDYLDCLTKPEDIYLIIWR